MTDEILCSYIQASDLSDEHAHKDLCRRLGFLPDCDQKHAGPMYIAGYTLYEENNSCIHMDRGAVVKASDSSQDSLRCCMCSAQILN